jgi:hypothetical protein
MSQFHETLLSLQINERAKTCLFSPQGLSRWGPNRHILRFLFMATSLSDSILSVLMACPKLQIELPVKAFRCLTRLSQLYSPHTPSAPVSIWRRTLPPCRHLLKVISVRHGPVFSLTAFGDPSAVRNAQLYSHIKTGSVRSGLAA